MEKSLHNKRHELTIATADMKYVRELSENITCHKLYGTL